LEIDRTYDITSKAEFCAKAQLALAAKKVNQKASDILKAIHYMSVDSSVTIRVLDVKSEWVEIQIIEPEHLSATHRGWIPKSSVQGGQSSAKVDGWIRHTAQRLPWANGGADLAGYLSPPASVGVADDGSGWLRLIHRTDQGRGVKQVR
jgi:sRNA-binding carbon storage regulator CsrA